MKKIALALAFAALPFAGLAGQVTPSTTTDIPHVSVSARGADVNGVLSDIFTQAKQQFVIQPDIHFALYISLKDADFDKTLKIVCHLAHLVAEQKDGVYYVRKAPRNAVAAPIEGPTPLIPKAVPAKATTTVVKAAPHPVKPTKVASKDALPHEAAPVKVPNQILSRKLTIRVKKAPIRDVFAELGKASNVEIVVASDVPEVRLDAYMIKTSLRYALDKIVKATGLRYEYSERGSILVCKA